MTTNPLGFFLKPYGSNTEQNNFTEGLKAISWDFYLHSLNTLTTPFITGVHAAIAFEDSWPFPSIPVILPLATGLIVSAALLIVFTLALVTRTMATLAAPVVVLDESGCSFNLQI